MKQYLTILLSFLFISAMAQVEPRTTFDRTWYGNPSKYQFKSQVAFGDDVRIYGGSLSVANDSTYADGSSILDVKSTSKGVLLPRMTTAQRNSIPDPETGLTVYDLTQNGYYYYNSTEWVPLVSTSGTETTFTNDVVFDGTLKIRGNCDSVPSGYVLTSDLANQACWEPLPCCPLDDSYDAGRVINADAGPVEIIGANGLKYVDGNEANGYVLTSDADGNATWQESSGGTSVLQTAKVFVPSSRVLTLGTDSLELIPAPGAGYAIEVISAAVKLDFGTVAYEGGTALVILQSSFSQYEDFKEDNILAETSTTMKSFNAQKFIFLENAPLYMKSYENEFPPVESNPTTGDSDITVYVSYRVIEL